MFEVPQFIAGPGEVQKLLDLTRTSKGPKPKHRSGFPQKIGNYINSRIFPGYSRIKIIKFPGLRASYLKQFPNANWPIWPPPPLTASRFQPLYYAMQFSSVR